MRHWCSTFPRKISTMSVLSLKWLITTGDYLIILCAKFSLSRTIRKACGYYRLTWIRSSFLRIGPNELMGCTGIGSNFIGVGRDHWLEMLDNPRKPVAQWYPLTETLNSQLPSAEQLPLSLNCLARWIKHLNVIWNPLKRYYIYNLCILIFIKMASIIYLFLFKVVQIILWKRNLFLSKL